MPLTLAPHFGGLWEAAVKSAKGLLNRTLANTRFTFEELSTVVVEIESILNSRPLTPLSSGPNDYSTLTAGHLLVGESLRSLPERSLENINLSSMDRYDAITALKQRFWKQWSADYNNELRSQRTSPRARWSSSMRTTCHRYDGLVRVVHLRTANGTCCRPIHKLAILPVV
ncbi:uncharacterized protein LOC117186014 [Drosophila miranda]|uniref:uncharacterized protein LOC117186014 n=1 Tax=Drosophila miranda TaxID=7229 RepID=UPI00143F9A67|nr:uncharacterized protein LOC117186014 [Drosophila miranda]